MTTTGHRRETSLETPLTTHHSGELLIRWAILEEVLLAVMIVTCQHDLLRPPEGLCLFYAEVIVDPPDDHHHDHHHDDLRPSSGG